MKHAVKDKKLHVNSVTIFALVLLSPLPFLSPFSYDLQPVQALPFNNFPPSQDSLPTIPTGVENIGLIDIKLTPDLYPTANLHTNTDFSFYSISSISAVNIGDSVFVMTAAKTTSSGNIRFLNVSDPESIYANSNYNSYRIGYNQYDNYNFALAIDTHPVKIDNFTYALVIIDGFDNLNDASTSQTGQEYGNAIQILNITDLSRTTKAKYVSELNNTIGLVGASHATTIKINGFTYALIASTQDSNVQIANITNVSDPTILSTITDGDAGYNVLGGASGIAAVQIDDSYYALVASILDGSLTIIDITDPASISNVSTITKNTYPKLNGAYDVTAVKIDNSYYALVASGTDDSLTIINITNPALPSNVTTFSDDATYTTLNRAKGISTIQLNGSYYAMVTSQDNSGLHMINLSIPSEPTLAYNITDEVDGYTALAGAKDIATIQIKDSNYSFVSGFADGAVQVIEHTFVPDPDTIPIIITSNNTNKMYAKAGDNITVRIKLNVTANNYTASILNETLFTYVTNSSNVLDASVIVPNYAIEGNATFNITVSHNANNLTITENDLRYTENVFVDTVSPNITLIGDTTHLVYVNTNPPNPPIPGAIATDKDPNYSGGYDPPSDILNTSDLGSVVNYTYTAHPDSAGNLGKSKNRTITVVESPPIAISSLIIHPFTNTHYLKKGDSFSISLDTDSIIIDGASLVFGTNNNNIHVYPFDAQRAQGPDLTTVVFYPTIPAGLNGNITFSITVTSNLGRTEIITQDNLKFSSYTFITADTIAPTIALNGNSTVIINIGDSYIDAGATITDNDASYSHTVTSNASSVNSSIAGTYIIVYSAPSDLAGNAPENVTRTVTVLPKPLGIAPGLGLAPVIGITDGIKYPTLSIASSITTTTIGGSTYALVASYLDNGVQIINITDPYTPTNVSSITDGTRYPTLGGASSITTATIEGSTYALVASYFDNGVQIINITDPYNPTNASSITDGTRYPTLGGANSITTATIGGSTYALVASDRDNGVQIINITDPYNPTNASSITDGTRYPELQGAHSITTATIRGSTYALVASYDDDGVQIINITDPYNPTNASHVTKGASYPKLEHAYSINTATIGGSIYALVASDRSGDGVQIINIDDPYNPTSVSSITQGAKYPVLQGATSITTTIIENSTYALATSSNGNGVQIINITDPYNPINASSITDGTRYRTLGGASSITTATIEGSTYALVASFSDNGVQITRLYSPLLSIISNNAHPLYAKTGDSLSIEFTVNNTIASSNASILESGLNQTITQTSRDLNYTVIVPSTQREEYANFNVQVTDIVGETLSITEVDLPFNVFIDTVSPRIDLGGPAEYFIITGTVDPIIPNVTVTDGDPNYSGGFTLNKSDEINTAIIGSVYNYTYTADADTAGNPGESVSRIITIIEADPITVTSLSIASSSGNNFANAGKTVTVTLVTNSTDLGNFTATLLGRDIVKENINSGTATFTTTVLSNDTNENVIFSITATNSSGNKIFVTNYDITDGSFVTIDTVKPVITLNGISPDTVLQRNKYADLGATVSDPSNSLYTRTVTASPRNLVTSLLGEQTITYSAPADAAGNIPDPVNRTVIVLTKPLGLVRDFVSPTASISHGASYQALDGPSVITTITINGSIYALVASSESQNTQIIDITDPYNPVNTSSFDHFAAFVQTENSLATAVIDGSTYALIGLGWHKNIQITNITDPHNPSNTTKYSLNNLKKIFRSITTVTINGSVYLLTVSSSPISVTIANITDPYNATFASSLTPGTKYPALYGASSITTATIENSTYALVASINDNGGVQIINITNPYNPTNASHVFNSDGYPALGGAHGIITTTIENSTYALVASRTHNGLQIINITDPYNPTNASYVVDSERYPTLNIADSVTTATIGGSTYALVGAFDDNGVQIINITDPYNPTNASSITDSAEYPKLNGPTSITSTTIGRSTYALVASFRDDGVQIIGLHLPISITANNSNPVYAKAGDSLNLEFTVNKTIASGNVSILESRLNATSIIDGYDFKATVIVPSTQREEYANFTVQVTDTTGKNVSITEDDLPSNVFIDTIRPRIKLDGNASYSISLNATNSFIPNVIITDGDPNYSGIFTLNRNATPDTSLFGSAYNYTYTADADNAGNLGESVSRIITITEVDPITVTSLSITSSSGNNFARADQNITIILETNGSNITNAIGTILNETFTSSFTGGSANFTFTVQPDDINGNATFSIKVTNSTYHTINITHADITDNSFVTIDTIKPVITVIGASNNTVFEGNTYQDPGTVITDASNDSYNGTVSATQLDTSIRGVQNITYTGPADAAGNIPDPVNRTITVLPKPLGIEPGLALSPVKSITDGTRYPELSDSYSITTVTIENSIYALIAAREDNGVQIINITDPYNPTNASSITDGTRYPELDRPHSITTVTIEGSTYALVASFRDNGVQIINITDPYNPTNASSITDGTRYPTLEGARSITTVTIENSIYALVAALADNGVQIINITDPYNPTNASSITNGTSYPALGGAISITTTTIERSTYALVASRNDDGVQIINITDPYNPTNASSITKDEIGTSTLELENLRSITTTTIGESTYALVVGYSGGVQIINITDPYTPTNVSSITDGTRYPTLGGGFSITTVTVGESTYALVASYLDNGVQVINIDDPYNPTNASSITDGTRYRTLEGASSITTTTIGESTYALVASREDNGVQIIRLFSPTLSIIANNANPVYAKAGDSLSIEFTVNNTIASSSASILESGLSQTITQTGRDLNYTVIVPPTQRESYANFTINVTDTIGENLSITEDDLPFNVFIDTVSPRIQLIGSSANYSIINGTDPIILNVTVTDGDPNYSGKFTLVPNATVNADINGSVYNYTYTAVADNAGNLGESVSRIITIIDAEPITVTSLSIASSPGNPNFANADKTITVTLVTDGTDLGNFTVTLLGRDIAKADVTSGTATFTTTVMLDDINENVTFSITATNSSENKILVTNEDITDGSFVTIDTVKPVITLNGTSPDTVLQGNSYTDLGANVSDPNNSLYNEIVTASTTNLETSSLGEQTITYSAPPDAAGNVPDSINRTVTVQAKPLGLETLTIGSNNKQNNLYAKIGDEITITLVANGTIGSATATIASNTITSVLTGSTLVASYIVDSLVSDTNSLAFIINASNEDGLKSVVFTEANLPNSSIIIDNTAPTITLVGNNNTVVPTNSSYTDPGAIASDLSYASDMTVNGVNNFDINKSGNYTFTYTAPDDEAGNPGPIITRNVIVKDTPPIGIDTFTIESNNNNTSYAKVGDLLYLILNVNNTIETNNVNVTGTTIDNIEAGATDKELLVDVLVSDSPIESNATFTITITNPSGTTLTVTKDDLTSSNVFIDTVSPRIKLFGPAEYFIINGTEEPNIPGVNVTDGDPHYSRNFILNKNGTIKNATIGSVYNYTYTAVKDNAGNLGDSVTRIITIIDANPINVTSLSIASSSGNNFANTGKTITVTLETDGNDLGNFTGTLLDRSFTNTTSGGDATFTTTVSSNDTNGNATFSITVTNSSGNKILVTNYSITDGSFVTIDTIKPVITVINASDNIVLYRDTYQDPGTTITDANNTSYDGTVTATQLNTSRLGVQNITYTGSADAAGNIPDPVNRTITVLPKPLGFVPGLGLSPVTTIIDGITYPELNIASVLTTTTIGGSTYALVASYLDNGVKIINITDPYNPINASSITNGTRYPTLGGAISITTTTIGESTYALVAAYTDNGVQIINITDPYNPTNASSITDGTRYPTLGGAISITTTTIGESTYALVAAYTDNGVQIINITDPYNPTNASSITDGTRYPTLNGSASITTTTIGGSTYALVAAAIDNGVQIINITDPYNPTNASSITDGTRYPELNTPIFITTTTIGGSTYALVAAYHDDGVQIINIDDPYNPINASSITNGTSFPTLNGSASITTTTIGESIYALVAASNSDGIQTINITDPYNPIHAPSITNGIRYPNLDGASSITAVTIENSTYALVASFADGGSVEIVRLHSPLLSIIANNTHPLYAKTGDSLSIEFTVNNTIASSSASILESGLNQTIIQIDRDFKATVIVPSTQRESYANFNINVTDTVGETLSITEDDLPFNVFIDTIRPNITLVGDVSYFISKDTINPFIPNVTVADGDPRYSGGFTLSTNDTNDTIDTAINGSVYNYTYTADADPAGNPGESVSRIITIIDANPINVTSLSIASSSGDNFANTSKTITVTLETDGSDLGNFTGTLLGRSFTNTTSGGDATFTTTVFSNDTNGNATFSITVTNSSGDRILVTNYNITDGSYVTIDTIKPVITVIDASNNTVFQGNTYQDPGTMITDANNTSYDGTVLATQLNTLILGAQNITYTGPADAAGNIPDPVNRTITVLPKPLGIAPSLALSPVTSITNGTRYPTLGGANSITTATIEDSTYALVTAPIGKGVQIINITDPYNPINASSITDGTSYPTLSVAISITTATIEDSTYALVASFADNGVQIINITDPYNPTNASHVVDSERYPTLDGATFITTATIEDSTYALVAASSDNGVQIINITDPYNSTNVSHIVKSERYPVLGGANSITTATIEGSTYALVTAPTDNGVQIINITDPYHPTNASNITDGTRYPTLNGANSITTATIGESTYALVTAYTDNGVQIINITDPYNPTNASSITSGTSYPTLNGANSITTATIGESTYALVTAYTDNGVQIINITDPYNPTNVSSITSGTSYPTLNGASSIITATIGESTYALVTAPTDNGVQIIKLSSPTLSIIANNSNPLYAKTGDSLSIEFTANNTLAPSSNVSILEPGLNATLNIDGRDFKATVIVPSTQRESYANFTINVTDTVGETLSITEDDLPFNVFIDTVSPRIELVGPAEYFIVTGTVNPIIPNVTVTDGDPNYSGGFTLNMSDEIDTAIIDSVYNYTYTADADTAGNIPDSVTRTITVLQKPLGIAPGLSLSPVIGITDSIKYPKLRGAISITTATIENSTYALVASFSENGVQIINIDDPYNPTNVSSISDGTRYPELQDAHSITTTTIEGSTYALVASRDDDGVQIINIDDPYNPTNVSSISDGTKYPELEGAISITTTTIGGSTYALVASRDDDGVQIINITDPYTPTNASSITDGPRYPKLQDAHSITTTTIEGSTYALVASRDDDGVQIINITDPYTPTNASSITDGPRYPTLQGASSITTTTIEGSTYALVTAFDDYGVQIINITDPYTPTNASSITDSAEYPKLNDPLSITSTTIGGSTYALVVSQNDDSVQVINITDPYTPTNVSTITDGPRYPTLQDASSITTATIGGSTYALVATIGNSGVQIIRLHSPLLSIFTSNTHPLYAKTGDSLSIEFIVNNTLAPSSNVSILESRLSASTIIDGRDFKSTVIVPSTQRESYANFTINVTDTVGETLSITEVDLPFNVFVDTIRPRIKLDGNASYSISLNTTNSFIPNVTITDKDPNYSGKFTLVPNATLDTSLFGSVYNYTYTADADNAGNLGESVSRIITITEVDPITVTSLSITSSSGNNFARADQNITIILETNGSNITNAIGTILNKTFTSSFTGGSANFTFTVQPDDINGNATFSIKVTNSTYHTINITRADITDGSFVTIDTVKPVITLNGTSPDTVLQGNSYTDLGATVSDPNNPSYTQTVTALPTNLETSSLGEQTITYSALADAAGNVPDSINRTVTVQAKPLGLVTLTIESDNAQNNLYAKIGDEITITLVANGTIGSATTTTIASNTITPALTDNTLVASYVVESSVSETNSLAFTISVSNADGTKTVVFTEANLPDSSITIDNTAPTITLIGKNNTVVFTNSSYTDPGATASDLSYAADIPVTGTSNFDITRAGNYTFTYTAPNDEANNTGPSITRNVIVKDTPPINLTSLTVGNEDSDNDFYAKAGDTLAWTIVTNYTVQSSTALLLGLSPSSSFEDGKTLFVKVIVPDDPTESNATFTITITNINGTTLTVTEDDLVSDIFIDTISPTIKLVGSADYYVIKDTSPFIPNATAHDGDPNYVANVTLVKSAPVDTSINGSVYNYTYTANSDTAGNPGASTSRIITVIDAEPITIESLSITSNSGNNFANAGKTITLTLETDGNDIGNFSGTLLGKPLSNTTNGGTATFTTTVLSGDTNGNVTFSIEATNSSGNRIVITEDDITDDSFVTIDTIKPVITLVGDTTDTVLQGDTYSDPGANINDPNNPSYTGTAVISPTNLDTSSIGRKIITYTGPVDAAGNVPDSINRTVTVQAKPLGLVTLTIESNNAQNNLYAKIGDEITITLVANGTIGSATTTTIASSTITPALTGNTLVASYVVDSSVSETNSLAFTIRAYNADGTKTVVFTEANLPDSSITIDNTAPTIVLVGNNNTIVATNSSYTDLGATASDLSYAADIPVTGTNNFDITQSGNYTFTYTAPNDEANNTGPSITRNVIVKDTPPIDIISFTIATASGTLYAKTGDTVYLTLEVNDTITSNNVQILSANVTSDSISGKSLYLQAQVSNNVTESNAEFNITITNPNGTTLIVTENDLTGSNIFIDTLSPRIQLIGGSANYSIVNGTMNPTILNVTVTDGDPNYSGNYTLTTPDGLVNANINGSVYNYTYTADADTAGNLGESVSRIITIIDADPITVTSLSIASNSGNNFANEGKTITVTLETDGSDLGNFTGTLLGRSFTNATSGGDATFTTTVFSNDTNGNATFSITATNSSGNRILVTNEDITDGSFVTIDTVSPTITLNGKNNTVIPKGGEPYVDLGATASDLSYATDIQLVGTGNVNHDEKGNYTLVYTDEDAAGNTATIIRNIIVKDAPPINITALTLNSSNSKNSLYAKHGDTLTITLTINYTIASYTATIFGISQSVQNQNSKGFIISEIVPSNLTVEENATFSITVIDEDGLSNMITQENLTSSNIFVDTIAPRIYLIGAKTHAVLVNSTDPFIPGAVVVDGDPNHPGNHSTTPNGNLNTFIINSVIIYTYTAEPDGAGNPGSSVTRTVIVKDKISTKSSSSNSAPTLGNTSSGAQLVTNGFEYNGLAVNVGRYHTEFPLIGTNVGDINTIKMKVYDSAGPTGIKRVEFALGVPDIGLYHEAEAFVEVWMQRDNITVQEIIIVDELNLLEDSDVSAIVSQTSCSGDAQQCLLVELQYSYREPPVYNMISIKPVNWDNNAHQFYFNDGIHVDGDSINLPKEITISASHATSTTHAGETLHLVQINRAEHLWVDQYGYHWKIIGNTVRQITVPEYLVPNDNTYGTLHGPDRNHPEFASSVYAEQKKAQETLVGILGHTTIIKPLPESSGTIYFNATGTDSRNSDSFKLLLELETTRMQQLSNLLYVDPS